MPCCCDIVANQIWEQWQAWEPGLCQPGQRNMSRSRICLSCKLIIKFCHPFELNFIVFSRSAYTASTGRLAMFPVKFGCWCCEGVQAILED